MDKLQLVMQLKQPKYHQQPQQLLLLIGILNLLIYQVPLTLLLKLLGTSRISKLKRLLIKLLISMLSS